MDTSLGSSLIHSFDFGHLYVPGLDEPGGGTAWHIHGVVSSKLLQGRVQGAEVLSCEPLQGAGVEGVGDLERKRRQVLGWISMGRCVEREDACLTGSVNTGV